MHGCSFFYTFYNAYNHHGEVVLSPDDLWTMVQLSFSRYINSDVNRAEKLRPLLVDFQGRKEIVVKIPAPIDAKSSFNKWNIFTDLTCKKMTELMLPGVVDQLTPQFSSTRPFDTFVSQAIVMDCFQAFFEYTLRYSCGISKVHFLGTQDDWNSLGPKLSVLRKYDDGQGEWTRYVDRLVPVFQKLAETYAGQLDSSWWNGILDERHAQGYGFGEPAELSGWLLRFYYDLPDKVEDAGDIHEMFARVPVTIDDHDMRLIKVKIFTGFSGLVIAPAQDCQDDSTRQVFRPHKSLAVIQERPEDDQVKTEPEGWYLPGNPDNYNTNVTSRDTDKPRSVHHTQLGL